MNKSLLILASILGIFLISTNLFIYKIYSVQKEESLGRQKATEEFCEALSRFEGYEKELIETYRTFLEDLGKEAFNDPNYKFR